MAMPMLDSKGVYVHASDTVPDLTPAVTTTGRYPPDPPACLHITLLSDVQSEASHVVNPIRPDVVDPYDPNPDPVTVTLSDRAPPGTANHTDAES